MRLLLLGATGVVGSQVLQQALSRNDIEEVIAPTRKPLRGQPRLRNPVVPQLERLAKQVASWRVDAVICALGTTQRKAGSRDAFRQVDYVLPLMFAKSAKAAGVRTFALVSAIGASPTSSFFYARTKGELERDVQLIHFESLTICRPSIIGGQRNESRFGEDVAVVLARVLAPILPKKFHVNPASVIARSLLRSVTETELGLHWILADEMN